MHFWAAPRDTTRAREWMGQRELLVLNCQLFVYCRSRLWSERCSFVLTFAPFVTSEVGSIPAPVNSWQLFIFKSDRKVFYFGDFNDNERCSFFLTFARFVTTEVGIVSVLVNSWQLFVFKSNRRRVICFGDFDDNERCSLFLTFAHFVTSEVGIIPALVSWLTVVYF